MIVEDLSNTAPDSVWYHYFDSRDNSGIKTTFRGFLLSLVQQMGCYDQCIHPSLQKLYGSCKKGLSFAPPTDMELKMTLRQIMEGFPCGYIMVDAMDECLETAEVIEWLADINQKYGVALTSRIFPEGRAKEIALQITMDSACSEVDDDIATYLKLQLEQCSFRGDLYNQILDTLLGKSHGQ